MARGLLFGQPVTFLDYSPNNGFDELVGPSGQPRDSASSVSALLGRLGVDELRARQRAAEATIRALGITFTVYSER
jgi:uncharacterized circularly permuted ATP-grasp superfamily protein